MEQDTEMQTKNLLETSASPAIIVLSEIRCPVCGKLACEASGIVKKRCDRCKTWFVIDTDFSKPSASDRQPG